MNKQQAQAGLCRKGYPGTLLMGTQTGATTTENSMEFPQKTTNVPFDLAIPLLGLHSRDPETPIQKNLCTPIFIAVLFTQDQCK